MSCILSVVSPPRRSNLYFSIVANCALSGSFFNLSNTILCCSFNLQYFCFRWISYNEAHTISTDFGKGLRVLGQQPRTAIAIFAETRAEWIMSALGAFSQSVYVATLYTNLGDDAIVHGINETEVREVEINSIY